MDIERRQKAAQLNVALSLFVQSVDLDDSTAMRVADLYPSWLDSVTNKTELIQDNVIKYGVNSFGETQLYKVLQTHTPTSDNTPDTATNLYVAMGVSNNINEWTQPWGVFDEYDIGDIVSYNGTTYESTVDNNTNTPNTEGWIEK